MDYCYYQIIMLAQNNGTVFFFNIIPSNTPVLKQLKITMSVHSRIILISIDNFVYEEFAPTLSF